MMLQDKYLPSYHFTETYRLTVNASPSKIFPFITQLDLSGSPVIRFLFSLRGMPASMLTLHGLGKGKFQTLETIPDKEIIIGLIGRFWVPSGDLQDFKPAEFSSLELQGYAKASWDFRLVPDGNTTVVETETRIFCCDETCRKKFSRYWFFIKPFSGLIRKEILKSIKRKAEA